MAYLTSKLVYEQVHTALDTTSLSASPIIFSESGQPETLTANTYSVSLQTTEITGSYADYERVIDTLTVHFVYQPNLMRQVASMSACFDLENEVSSALLTQTNLPSAAIYNSRTTRKHVANQEYMIISMDFEVHYNKEL